MQSENRMRCNGCGVDGYDITGSDGNHCFRCGSSCAVVPPEPRDESRNYGRIGYEAYAAFTGGKTYNGLPMPKYDALPANIMDAWESAALAIITQSLMAIAEGTAMNLRALRSKS